MLIDLGMPELFDHSALVENKAAVGDLLDFGNLQGIDENGLADFSEFEKQGKAVSLAERRWDNRMYLWPIPTAEIVINPNMSQNPGY